MATRRIARGRSGSPVPVIVLSVLVVGLVAASIIFGLKAADLEEKLVAAENDIQTEKKARITDQRSFTKFEQAVGWDLDQVDAQYHGLLKELNSKGTLPSPYGDGLADQPQLTVVDLLKGYADRCNAQEQMIADLTKQLAGTKSERDEARTEIVRVRENGEKSVADEQARYQTLEQDKKDVEAKLQSANATLSTEVEKLKGTNAKLRTDIASAQQEIEKLLKQLEKRDELISELRNPKRETPPFVGQRLHELVDGKVIRVDADGEYVMIDLGREDWVGLGMVFQVYDRADPATRTLKGRIQVRRVMDTIAQCKVLEQDKIDPILPGMFIINPAFKRGRTVVFAIAGRPREPNLKRLLERYPCKIEPKPSSQTDYLILGGATVGKDDIPVEDTEEYERAKELKITMMKEADLLRYLGESQE
jgi:hypothetical protein